MVRSFPLGHRWVYDWDDIPPNPKSSPVPKGSYRPMRSEHEEDEYETECMLATLDWLAKNPGKPLRRP
jgi:hypothetical protein